MPPAAKPCPRTVRGRALRAALAGWASLWTLGCGGGEPELSGAALAPRRGGTAGEALFRRHDPAACGVVFHNRLLAPHVLPYLYNGAGLAVGDYDGDGLPDLYLVAQDGPNKLFRQKAPFRFEDVTERAGVAGGEAWGSGATFVDFDGDGDLDLYVCNTEAPNLLYRNDGGGRFEECAASVGLAHVGASTMPAFADYDNDGDVDLYLVENRVFGGTLMQELLAAVRPPADTRKTVAEMAPPMPELRQDEHGEWVIPPQFADHLITMVGRVFFGGQRDRLFRNEGGRFVDRTEAAGIRDQGMGLSATWCDLDGDGFVDLYVANDLESPDVLYRNRRDGTFEDVTREALPQLAYFGMGSDAADIDNDGRFDLLVADMSATTHYKAKMLMGDMGDRARFLSRARPSQQMRNALFLNTGTPRFMEIAYLAGVASTDWTWAVKFGDLDNDGWVDLFVTNGIPRFDNNPDIDPRLRALWRQGRRAEALALARDVPAVPERNLAFKNDRALRFENVSAAWGLDLEGLSHGAVFSDLDRDGDLDIVVNNMNSDAAVYENLGQGGHAVLIRLRGTRSNTFGLGARVEAWAGSDRLVRELTLPHGYLSADEPLLHFGLGEQAAIDRLEVRWPSGSYQEFKDLPADRLYTITEPSEPAPPPVEEAMAPPWFADATGQRGLDVRHTEREFDDFAAEPLLPHKHSQLGPGLCWGDANGDGRDDLFVGGAAGQAGTLFLSAAGGGFRAASGPWNDDAAREDMGALFFDLDADLDLDLYVASGSVECAPGDDLLRDRIYLNDGHGTFVAAPAGTLPDIADSGSSVAAADFDRDGDLDLFVGGRVIPGRYPNAPPSRLLRNDSGHLSDVTAEVAPGLASAGLVTSALWSDADQDGFVDLLVTAHWQPIRLFHNQGGQALEDRTAEAGLASSSGWWNGIASGDLDGDGDLDYVATNVGLNTKYKASPEHPARLYCSDFDGDGKLDVVEAKYQGDTLLPVRGRSCSSQAMPVLAERFPTFDSFARASLQEIYSLDALNEAQVLEATTLAHAMLINRGDGTFEVRPLPRLAQAAPGFGVALCDFDQDGRTDIYVAQNFSTPEPETGRMAGGVGMLLRNAGALVFEPLMPDRSGILVPGDARGLALCDVDGDGRPDLSMTTNDGPLRVFDNRCSGAADRALAVRLEGPPGNGAAAGARLRLVDPAGRVQIAEVHAGSGYLSQSAPMVFFGLGDPGGPGAGRAAELTVTWPSGETTRIPVAAGGPLTIRHP